MISIKALLTEKELADQFVASLKKGMLEEKFFYWFPLSVRAWLDLCSDGAYRNFVRSRSLIATSAGQIAALLPPGQIEVVSIGSGQGDKDLLILQALASQSRKALYRPVDSSQALLEMACGLAQEAGFSAEGMKADFARSDHLTLVDTNRSAPRLVMMLGNTLGSVDPVQMAATLGKHLMPGDHLLVDGELYGPETMAGYDNPLNRRFAWSPLNSVGIGEHHGELIFEEHQDNRFSGLYKVAKHFEAKQRATAVAGGEHVEISPGQRVEMNHSYKYSAETFLWIHNTAGLEPVWQAQSGDSKFLMVLSKPAG